MCKLCCTYIEINPIVVDYYNLSGKCYISQTNAWDLITINKNLLERFYKKPINTDEYTDEYYAIKKQVFDEYFTSNETNTYIDIFKYEDYRYEDCEFNKIDGITILRKIN